MTDAESNPGPSGKGGVPSAQPGSIPRPGWPSYIARPEPTPPWAQPPHGPQTNFPSTPPQSQFDSFALAPAAAHNWWTSTRKLIVGIIAGFVVLVGLVAAATAISVHSGYNDPNTLEASILERYNSDDSGPEDAVEDVTCIGTGNHAFRCLLTYESGDTLSVHVDVSADGTRWISTAGR